VSTPADRVEQRPKTTGGSAKWVAAGILASRLSGLVREGVLAHYLGATAFADVFRAALRIPNMLQNLLGEGTLSASFIPVYARLLHEERKEEAGHVAGAMFGLLLAVSGALALLGAFAAPLLTDLFAPGFEGAKRDLTVVCMRIIFPMTGVLVLSAWALGILNSHRRFFISYVAPVIWNVAIIAVAVFFGARMVGAELTIAVSWGALLGGVLQFLVQMPFVLRLQRELRVSMSTQHPAVRQAIRNAGPAILGRGVVQLSAFLDIFIASFLQNGAVAVLSYAQMFYILPVSLFGMSVAAAELPEMSREGSDDVEKLKARLSAGLRQIALLVVPSAVGYILLGDVVAGIFQSGAFKRADTVLVALTLAGYSLGLLASTATRLIAQVFFALHDTKTPAKIAFARVTMAGLIGGAATLLLRTVAQEWLYYGPVVLATAAGLAAWLEWFLLRAALARRIGHVSAGRGDIMRMIVAALIAAVGARVLYLLLPDWPLKLQAIIVLIPFGLAYFVTAQLLGVEEAALSRVIKKMRR
jgi:putative peptidoglycan lipid II flippase